MTFKRIISFGIVAFMVIASCSCSNKNKETNITEANEKTPQTISISYFKSQQDIERAILVFRSQNINVNISEDVVDYNIETLDAFSNKLITALNTGEGPDIILFDMNCFNSISKATSSGAFCDLNNFFKDDKEMDLSNYYKNIFDCGVYKNKRYFVPLRAYTNILITTESILGKNNISIDYKNWTWKDLFKVAEDFSKNNKKSSKYLLNYISFDFLDIVYSFGKSFIDVNNKKSNFNNPELVEALKVYKELKELQTLAPEFTANSEMINDPVKGLKSDYYAMYVDFLISNSDFLLYSDHKFKNELGEGVVFIPFPSWYGNGYIKAEPGYLIGINSNCKNKECAYKFVKFLLSDDSQSLKPTNGYNFNYRIGYPVNKRALTRDLDTMKSNEVDKINFDYTPISDDLLSRFKFMVNNTGALTNYDRQVQITVLRAVKDYLNGKMSEEQALSRIDNEVQIFLNE